MTDQRGHFHREITKIEESVLGVASRVDEMIERAVMAVTRSDLEAAEWVIQADSEIDKSFIETHSTWVNLMARQGPMGSDLRLMSALLQMNVTLERSGDQCVNIAKAAKEVAALPHEQRILHQIQEMGDLVRPMLRTAIRSYVERDAEMARTLHELDEPVDILNHQMYQEVLACGSDQGLLEWATKMMLVARALERLGDQAVDIGEQVAYVVTGEYHEFNEENGR